MERIKGSNLRKIVYILIAIIIVVCIAFVAIKVYNKQRCLVAIQDDNVCYDMTKRELLKIKGEPNEIETYNDTPFYEFHYIEIIDGYEAETWYSFYEQTVFPDRLNGVSVNIKISDADEARALFYKLYDRLNEYYKTQRYYFCNDIEEISPAEYSVTLGTDDGAVGIRIKMEYVSGKLRINSDYLR